MLNGSGDVIAISFLGDGRRLEVTKGPDCDCPRKNVEIPCGPCFTGYDLWMRYDADEAPELINSFDDVGTAAIQLRVLTDLIS